MQRRLFLLLAAVWLAACGPRTERAPERAADRRQRDSVVARSRLPGAKAVDRALGVREASETRASALDSIR
jgi:hypothetical protein